ncbi:MAG: hypothetical protein Kow00117_22190 [Phototrophicales bacterium]
MFNRRVRDMTLLCLAGGLVAFYVMQGGGGFPLDDSWIHQTYARNLAEYGEWSFIPGQPSGASTSPLYTLILALGYVFHIPYEFWTHFIGALALAAAGMLGARLADDMMPAVTFGGWFVGLAVVTAWHLVWAAASGMETMLFCALILGLMLLGLKHNQTRRDGVWFGVVGALTVATRPEGALLVGMIGSLNLKQRNWVIGSAFGFGVAILPYLLLNLSLNGELVPNTSAAKQAQHAILLQEAFGVRVGWMIEPLLAGGQFTLIPGIVVFMWWARHKPRFWLPLLWALGLILLYAWRLPAAYQHGRYVIPALPGLIVIGVLGVLLTLKWTRDYLIGRVFVRSWALVTLVLFTYFGLILGVRIYQTDLGIINDEMVAQAKWIRDHLPPDELLAVHDIGAVGYFAPRPLLDIAGLITPEVIPLIGKPDALWAYIEASGAQYLMAFPDQIPNQNPGDPRLCFLHNSPGDGSTRVGGPKMTIYRLGGCD